MTDRINAPIARLHREEAIRLTGSNSPGTKHWLETGDYSLVGVHRNTKYYRAVRIAQSIANVEAAIHARYAGLVERVRESCVELRATGGDQNVLGWLERGLKELEE